MAMNIPRRVKSFLESSEWGAPEGAARPTPGASHASARKNSGGAYVSRVDADAPLPSLHDDPEFAEIDKRYTELQGEYGALDAEIDRLNSSLSVRSKSEAERRLVEASALTSRPIASDAKPLSGIDEVHRTLEALGARRALVWRALQLQTRLRNDAFNRASQAALAKARPHHRALVLQATAAAIELSRHLQSLSDYVYSLEQRGIMVSDFYRFTPPGEGGGVGRMAEEFSPIRVHLRRLADEGYPLPPNAHLSVDQRGAA